MKFVMNDETAREIKNSLENLKELTEEFCNSYLKMYAGLPHSLYDEDAKRKLRVAKGEFNSLIAYFDTKEN